MSRTTYGTKLLIRRLLRFRAEVERINVRSLIVMDIHVLLFANHIWTPSMIVRYCVIITCLIQDVAHSFDEI
jgi:hypothetical protein